MPARNRILVLIGVVLLVLLSFAGYVFLEIARSTPAESIVRSEFLRRYPNSTIRNVELIFEQDGSVVYLVKAQPENSSEIRTYDFALDRKNGVWRWCDDQTDIPCGPIAK